MIGDWDSETVVSVRFGASNVAVQQLLIRDRQ